MLPEAMIQTIEHGMFVRSLGEVGELGTLLYIHGLGESGLCFEKLVCRAELAGARQLIPDLPGYGRSAWRDQPLSLVEHADLLAALLRARGEQGVTLVGHSMGGVVALLLAERHRDLVARLIDVDGNVSPPDCAFSSQATAVDLDLFRAASFAALIDQIYRDGLGDAARRGYYVSLRLCDPRAYHQNSTELVAESQGLDIAERLVRLDVPVVYIAGAPRGASRRSRALLDHAGVRTVEISPAGHWPFIDQPDAFTRAMLDFLG
jgi:pimeloyl-ACP methyl ester carboxylesterase